LRGYGYTMAILRDLALYLAWTLKGVKKGPKKGQKVVKKGSKMTQKRVKNDPKMTQK
jgi:hypothetical protein